jgi:hypothetical protein
VKHTGQTSRPWSTRSSATISWIPEQAKDWGLIDEIVENRGSRTVTTARSKVDGVTAPASGGFCAKYAIVVAAGLI